MSADLTVTIRFFAAARAAAGHDEERVTVAADTSVAGLVARLGTERPALATVLARCSFLHDEVVVRDTTDRLRDGATIDVLPPFAGG